MVSRTRFGFIIAIALAATLIAGCNFTGPIATGLPDQPAKQALPRTWVTPLPSTVSPSKCDVTISDITAEPKTVPPGGIVKLTVSVSNPEGKLLEFNWRAVYGKTDSSPISPEASYIAPGAPANDTVRLWIDADGCILERAIEIPVVGSAVTSTVTSAPTPDPSQPTPCPDTSPYRLDSSRMMRLICPSGPFVSGRYIVTQRYERGFMIVFDGPKNSKFTALNEQRKFYALADDHRAWRIYFNREDVPQNTSPNPDDWYSCNAQSGKRPSESGIPWRGFGMVWCGFREIREALGNVVLGNEGEEELSATSFQSYYAGRAFLLHGRRYIVYLDMVESGPDNFLIGQWE